MSIKIGKKRRQICREEIERDPWERGRERVGDEVCAMARTERPGTRQDMEGAEAEAWDADADAVFPVAWDTVLAGLGRPKARWLRCERRFGR